MVFTSKKNVTPAQALPEVFTHSERLQPNSCSKNQRRKSFVGKKLHMKDAGKKEHKRIQEILDKKMKLQGLSTLSFVDGVSEAINFAQKYVNEDIVKFIEDVLTFAYILQNGHPKIACTTFIKLRSGTSIVSSIGGLLKGMMASIMAILEGRESWQTSDFHLQGLEDNINDFRNVLDQWDDVKRSSIGIKYWKVVSYMIRFGVFQQMGINATPSMYKGLAQVSPLTLLDGTDFIYCVVDALTLTIQRILIWKRTGDWQVMIHGPRAYQKWFDKCSEIKRHSTMLSNLELVGKNYFEFVDSVKSAIAEGESIARFGTDKFEVRAAKSMLNDMKMIDLNVLSAKAARAERPAPFGILINGFSGVAKSNFQQILFKAYGLFRNLPTSNDYRYVREPRQQFWNGFASYMWCIQLDDVAYLNKDQGVDESMKELLSLLNNVPFVPDQAAIEDKGKTPVRCEFVIASTNTKHLNTDAHFSCPLAILRRMPWVITVKPKPEYACDDKPEMLDGMKVDKKEGEWMNVWIIKVEKVVPGGKINDQRETAKHVPALPAGNGKTAEENSTFTDIYLFLDWFKTVVLSYNEMQHKAMMDVDDMGKIKLCPVCNRPQGVPTTIPKEHRCVCELQSDGISDAVCVHEKYGNLSVTIVGKTVFGVKDATGKVLDIGLTGLAYGAPIETSEGVFKHRFDIVNGVVVRESVFPLDNQKQAVSKTDSLREAGLNQVLDRILDEQIKQEPKTMNRIGMWVGRKCVQWYFDEGWFYNCIQFAMSINLIRKAMVNYLSYHLDSVYSGRSLFEKLGQIRASSVYGSFAIVIAGLAALVTAYYGFKAFTSTSKKESKHVQVREISDEECAILSDAGNETPEEVEELHCGVENSTQTLKVRKDEHIQVQESQLISKIMNEESSVMPYVGATQSSEVSDEYFEKTEKENVWKKVDMEVTSFDVDPMSVNYATLKGQQLFDIIRRNVFRMDACANGRGQRSHAVCVGGYLFVACNHTMPEGEEIAVQLNQEPTSDGVSSNVHFILRPSDILRMPENDLVWFRVFAMSPKKDLSHLLAKPSMFMGRYRGNYVGREVDTQPLDIAVRAIEPFVAVNEELSQQFNYWKGRPQIITKNGFCGAPLLVVHDNHVEIVGLHQLGSQEECCAVSIHQELFERAQRYFKRPIIQSGVPQLQADAAPEKVLEPIGHKSPLRWVKSGSLNKYGHIRGARMLPRSKVKTTILAEKIIRDREWECTFQAPRFDWRPYNHMYNDILGGYDNVDSDILESAISAYANDIISGLNGKSLDTLKIISWEAALNGIDGVQYIDKMNFNSSMGFPWNKSKKYFLTEDEDSSAGKKTLPAFVWKRAAEAESRYKEGVRFCPVFSGQCKDEARQAAKVAAGKIRVFTGAPVDWSLCVRRYLLTFIKAVMENQELFEAAPGCVAQSLEWERFREYLTQFGEDRIVAGDYGKFDKRMSAKMILAAFEIIVRVLRAAGWSEDELKVIYGIANDTAYPLTVVDGDLVEFFGSNPSGHPLTVIINSLVNALYMRYCYIQLNPEREATSFKEKVALLTYGDDNTMGVHKDADWFNHTRIKEQLAMIGVEYTMADKESESVPFIDIADVSFLKRKWRWDADVDAWLCPLDPKSIQKSLLINIPSKSISQEAQMIDVMNSAVSEWFFHGKEVFEYEREYLLKVVRECNLEDEYVGYEFPTWDQLVHRFKWNSKDVRLERFGGVVAPPSWHQTK